MDFKDNEELQKLAATFDMMEDLDVISSEDEIATASEPEQEVPVASQYIYKIPQLSMSSRVEEQKKQIQEETKASTRERPETKDVTQTIEPNGSSKSDENSINAHLGTKRSMGNERLGNLGYFDAFAQKYMDCMNDNPTTFHFVRHFASVLSKNGFTELPQQQSLEIGAGMYFTTLEDQSLVAFIKGAHWKPLHGSCFVGTHVDAVGIKVNPQGSFARQGGYEQLLSGSYSGPIADLWVQRDLGLAGAVIVRQGEENERVLIDSKVPIGTIPSAPGSGKIVYNLQTTGRPVVGIEREETSQANHSPVFLSHVAKLAGCDVSDIASFDLHLYDTQKAVRGGLEREFIFSSSLDDRLCSFDAMHGLLEFASGLEVDSYDGLVGVYFANHEEIGSGSRTGAQGGLLLDTLKRLVPGPEQLLQLTQNTVFLSSDVTHCLNPNFRDIYLEKHMPKPNVGPTVKVDSNQHVLTDSIAQVFLEQLCEKYVPEVQLQQFHIRNDSRSGGTIGPMMSGRRGLNGARLIIDVGMPILAMHSVRSMMGYKDVGLGVLFFKGVFGHWIDVASQIEGA